MKKLISLLVFASIVSYVGNSMAINASQVIGKRNLQIQQIGE